MSNILSFLIYKFVFKIVVNFMSNYLSFITKNISLQINGDFDVLMLLCNLHIK